MSIFRGTENVNRLWVYPITTADGRSTLGEPVKLIDTADAEYTFIRTDGCHLYLHTDLDAPLGRVIRLNVPGGELTEVVPESDATLSAVEAAGDGLLLAYLDDAQHRVEYRNLDGSDPCPVDLPAGALVALDSSPLRDEAFVGLSTIATPTASFHVPLPIREHAPATEESDRSKGQTLPAQPIALSAASERFAPSFTMERHRAPSADGTPVPYFLITPDDDHSGPRPTLLYGYGGFKIPVLADYRPGWSAWLATGGALAIANLRGGGEFGTRWYDDGRLANKQRVFDDFIGVAEHLISTGVTTSQQLAIYGRSNGGLLVGAALAQRPDLFAAAMPTVGVLDVLRFHKFTIGSAWISDFGDPDTPEGFDAAYTYSPATHVPRGGATAPRRQRQPRPGATSLTNDSSRCALYSTPSWLGTVTRTCRRSGVPRCR